MAVISRTKRYVIQLGDNASLPEEKQITAFLKPVSVYQKQDQLRKFIGVAPDDLMKQMTKREETNEIFKILNENVVRFENLEIETESGNVPATMKDLWELGEFELCMELFNALMRGSQLKDDERKNSESPSGTSVNPVTH